MLLLLFLPCFTLCFLNGCYLLQLEKRQKIGFLWTPLGRPMNISNGTLHDGRWFATVDGCEILHQLISDLPIFTPWFKGFLPSFWWCRIFLPSTVGSMCRDAWILLCYFLENTCTAENADDTADKSKSSCCNYAGVWYRHLVIFWRWFWWPCVTNSLQVDHESKFPAPNISCKAICCSTKHQPCHGRTIVMDLSTSNNHHEKGWLACFLKRGVTFGIAVTMLEVFLILPLTEVLKFWVSCYIEVQKFVSLNLQRKKNPRNCKKFWRLPLGSTADPTDWHSHAFTLVSWQPSIGKSVCVACSNKCILKASWRKLECHFHIPHTRLRLQMKRRSILKKTLGAASSMSKTFKHQRFRVVQYQIIQK